MGADRKPDANHDAPGHHLPPAQPQQGQEQGLPQHQQHQPHQQQQQPSSSSPSGVRLSTLMQEMGRRAEYQQLHEYGEYDDDYEEDVDGGGDADSTGAQRDSPDSDLQGSYDMEEFQQPPPHAHHHGGLPAHTHTDADWLHANAGRGIPKSDSTSSFEVQTNRLRINIDEYEGEDDPLLVQGQGLPMEQREQIDIGSEYDEKSDGWEQSELSRFSSTEEKDDQYDHDRSAHPDTLRDFNTSNQFSREQFFGASSTHPNTASQSHLNPSNQGTHTPAAGRSNVGLGEEDENDELRNIEEGGYAGIKNDPMAGGKRVHSSPTEGYSHPAKKNVSFQQGNHNEWQQEQFMSEKQSSSNNEGELTADEQSLVEMGFEPRMVRAALRKHHNVLDAAVMALIEGTVSPPPSTPMTSANNSSNNSSTQNVQRQSGADGSTNTGPDHDDGPHVGTYPPRSGFRRVAQTSSDLPPTYPGPFSTEFLASSSADEYNNRASHVIESGVSSSTTPASSSFIGPHLPSNQSHNNTNNAKNINNNKSNNGDEGFDADGDENENRGDDTEIEMTEIRQGGMGGASNNENNENGATSSTTEGSTQRPLPKRKPPPLPLPGIPESSTNAEIEAQNEEKKLAQMLATPEGALFQFPEINLYQLEEVVFDGRYVPLGLTDPFVVCVLSARKLALEGRFADDPVVQRFVSSSFAATIEKMCEGADSYYHYLKSTSLRMVCQVIIDLVIATIPYDCVPVLDVYAKLLSALLRPTYAQTGNSPNLIVKVDPVVYAKPADTRYSWSYEFTASLINYFGNQGGFEAVTARLNDKEKPVSPAVLSSLLAPYGKHNASELMTDACRAAIVPLRDYALNYVMSGAIVDLPSREYENMSNIMEGIKKISSEEESVDIDKYRLATVLKCLSSSTFNARMNAMKEIHRLWMESDRFAKFLNEDFVLQWMSDNQILQKCLRCSFLHQIQYCKKLEDILVLANRNNSLTNEDLAYMWSLQNGAHDAVIRNVQDLFARLSFSLKASQLQFLFQCFKQSWSADVKTMERQIQFIRRLGKEDREGKLAAEIKELLWSVSHDPTTPSPIITLALDCHSKMFEYADIQERQLWLDKCVADLESEAFCFYALGHIRTIGDTFYSYNHAYNTYAAARAYQLKELINRHSMYSKIYASLERCHSSALSLKAKNPEKNSSELLLASGHSFFLVLKQHLALVKYLSSETVQDVPYAVVESMWVLLMVRPLDAQSYALVLEWVNDINITEKDHFFHHYILSLKPSTLTLPGFLCFKKLFMEVNVKAGRIKSQWTHTRDDTFEVKTLDLLGIRFAWLAAITGECKEVCDAAAKFLIDDIANELSFTHSDINETDAILKELFSNISKYWIMYCGLAHEGETLQPCDHLFESTPQAADVLASSHSKNKLYEDPLTSLPSKTTSFTSSLQNASSNVPNPDATATTFITSPTANESLSADINASHPLHSSESNEEQEQNKAGVSEDSKEKPDADANTIDSSDEEFEEENNTTQHNGGEEEEVMHAHVYEEQTGPFPLDKVVAWLVRCVALLHHFLQSSSDEIGSAHKAIIPHMVAGRGSSIVLELTMKKSKSIFVRTHTNAPLVFIRTQYAEAKKEQRSDFHYRPVYRGERITRLKTKRLSSIGICHDDALAFRVLNQVTNFELGNWDEHSFPLQVQASPLYTVASSSVYFPLLIRLADDVDGTISMAAREILGMIPTHTELLRQYEALLTIPCPFDYAMHSSHSSATSHHSSNFNHVMGLGGPSFVMSHSASTYISATQKTQLDNARKQLSAALASSFPFSSLSATQLLYHLQTIHRLVLPAVAPQFDESMNKFRHRFILGGGVEMLLNILRFDNDKYAKHQRAFMNDTYALVMLLLDFLVSNILEIVQPFARSLGDSPEASLDREGITAKAMGPTLDSMIDAESEAEKEDGGSDGTVRRPPNSDIVAEFERTRAALSFKWPSLECPFSDDVLRALVRAALNRVWCAALGEFSVDPRTFRLHSKLNTTDESLIACVCDGLSLLRAIFISYNHLISELLAFEGVADLLLDLLIGCQSVKIREATGKMLLSASYVQAVNASHPLSPSGPGLNPSPAGPEQNYAADHTDAPLTEPLLVEQLLKMLLDAPLPLWNTSLGRLRGRSSNYPTHSFQFFQLLSGLLRVVVETKAPLLSLQLDIPRRVNDEVVWLSSVVLSDYPEDDPSRAKLEWLLAGHLIYAKTLISFPGIAKTHLGSPDGSNLVSIIAKQYLFPSSTLVRQASLRGSGQGGGVSTPVSANLAAEDGESLHLTLRQARLAAYAFLAELCGGSDENISSLIALLRDYLALGSSLAAGKWDVLPPITPRPSPGFVGLKNAGATCYMNSVLQQLYMHPVIRDSVLSVPDAVEAQALERKPIEQADKEKGVDHTIFYQLQSIFAHLTFSQMQAYVPEGFWKTFRLFGQAVNLREHQDALEFLNNLVDQLDEHLKSASLPPFFQKIYGGMFADQKVCRPCPHQYEREEHFTSVSVNVHGNKTLTDALYQYVKGDLLTDDNQYYCEMCAKKVDALKRTCIKVLPQTLVIHLKRFDYDWENGRAIKFNDHFTFPDELDMEPFTVEGLARVDARERANNTRGSVSSDGPSSSTNEEGVNIEKEKGTGEIESESDKGNENKTFPSPDGGPTSSSSSPSSSSSLIVSHNPCTKFVLRGVAVHSGMANAGHYYSYVKMRTTPESLADGTAGQWFKFDDNKVTLEENIDKDSLFFGGKYTAEINGFQQENDRFWSGYLLFYERVDIVQDLEVKQADLYKQRLESTAALSHSLSLSLSTTPLSNTLSRNTSHLEPQHSVEIKDSPSHENLNASLSDVHAKLSALNLGSSLEEESTCDESNTNNEDISLVCPPSILRSIRSQNIAFMHQREIFNVDFFGFVNELVKKVSSSSSTHRPPSALPTVPPSTIPATHSSTSMPDEISPELSQTSSSLEEQRNEASSVSKQKVVGMGSRGSETSIVAITQLVSSFLFNTFYHLKKSLRDQLKIETFGLSPLFYTCPAACVSFLNICIESPDSSLFNPSPSNTSSSSSTTTSSTTTITTPPSTNSTSDATKASSSSSSSLSMFLLECSSYDIREKFCELVVGAVKNSVSHHLHKRLICAENALPPHALLIEKAISLIDKPAIEHYKQTDQLFTLIHEYLKIGPQQRQHALRAGLVERIVSFLGMGDSASNERRWNNVQMFQFSQLYACLLVVLFYSDLSPFLSLPPSAAALPSNPYKPEFITAEDMMPLHAHLNALLFQSKRFITEVLASCGDVDEINDLVLLCSWNNLDFTNTVLGCYLHQLSSSQDPLLLKDKINKFLHIDDSLRVHRWLVLFGKPQESGILNVVHRHLDSMEREKVAYLYWKYFVSCLASAPWAHEVFLPIRDDLRSLLVIFDKVLEREKYYQTYSSNETTSTKFFVRTQSSLDTIRKSHELLEELDLIFGTQLSSSNVSADRHHHIETRLDRGSENDGNEGSKLQDEDEEEENGKKCGSASFQDEFSHENEKKKRSAVNDPD